MRTAALEHAGRGWAVFPVTRRKAPLTRHGHLDGTTNRALISRLWAPGSRFPGPGVAIATGRGSGLVVIDVDPVHGGDESLHELELEHGVLRRTVEVITARDGRHLYFRHPGPDVRNSVGAIAAGAALPGWLLKRVGSPQRSRRPAGYWRTLARDGVAQGARNVACAQLAGHLLGKRVDPTVVLGLLLGWNQRNLPPLAEEEVARTRESIADREGPKWKP